MCYIPAGMDPAFEVVGLGQEAVRPHYQFSWKMVFDAAMVGALAHLALA
jgi:hypothetical protein